MVILAVFEYFNNNNNNKKKSKNKNTFNLYGAFNNAQRQNIMQNNSKYTHMLNIRFRLSLHTPHQKMFPFANV